MHPAGQVSDIWRHMWGFLSWTPPPSDPSHLTMRWWPWWRQHLHVRQVTRAPFMAWLPKHCGVDRVRVLHATRAIMDARLPPRRRRRRGGDGGRDVASAHYRRRGHVFHWWCHGQLVGVLLPRRRLVLGSVQKVAHRHARHGWERRITLRHCGDITYRQHSSRGQGTAGGATFCWEAGDSEEQILETWSLEPPFSTMAQRRGGAG